MAMRVETNPLETAYVVLLEHGMEGAGEALRILVNEAAKIERTAFLGAAPYERSVRLLAVTTPTASSPRPCSPVWGS